MLNHQVFFCNGLMSCGCIIKLLSRKCCGCDASCFGQLMLLRRSMHTVFVVYAE